VFEMLNPILRATNSSDAEHYRGEPYVVSGDIAAFDPHRGRSGWTWYTGSASWTWRLAIEGILGLRLVDGRIRIDPRIPSGWGGYEATLRNGRGGSLNIRVEDPDGLGQGRIELTVDGVPYSGVDVEFPAEAIERRIVACLMA